MIYTMDPSQWFGDVVPQLGPGDSLYLRGGIYQQLLSPLVGVNMRAGTASAPITVMSYPGESAMILSPGTPGSESPSLIELFVPYWNFRSLILDGNFSAQAIVRNSTEGGENLFVLEKCNVGKSWANALHGFTGTIRNCEVHTVNPATIPPYVNGGYGLYSHGFCLIEGCYWHDLAFEAINAYQSPPGGDVKNCIGVPMNWIIRNNIFKNNNQDILYYGCGVEVTDNYFQETNLCFRMAGYNLNFRNNVTYLCGRGGAVITCGAACDSTGADCNQSTGDFSNNKFYQSGPIQDYCNGLPGVTQSNNFWYDTPPPFIPTWPGGPPEPPNGLIVLPPEPEPVPQPDPIPQPEPQPEPQPGPEPQPEPQPEPGAPPSPHVGGLALLIIGALMMLPKVRG